MDTFRRMINVDIPLTKQGFYKPTELSGNRNAIIRIKNNFGTLVDGIAKMNGFDNGAWMATLFFIESRGVMLLEPDKYGSVGLGQINLVTVAATLFADFKNNRISNDELTILNKVLGTDTVEKIRKEKLEVNVTKYLKISHLQNLEFNILLSTMYFRRCLDRELTVGTLLRPDKAIVYYNSSWYKVIPPSLNTDGLLNSNSLSVITKDYIRKFVGQNTPLLDAAQIFS